MGEIADMMMDGTLCSECGAYVGSEYDCPTLCDDCRKEYKINSKNNKKKKQNKLKES
jgi:hypothetical protein